MYQIAQLISNIFGSNNEIIQAFSNFKDQSNSNNKLINSNDIHPYTYDSCDSYFFASSTKKTGEITVTWPANSANQAKHWSASDSTHSTDNLKTCFEKQNLWYLVIGPRHYNTGWGDEGIGAGTNGYWENCDYYVG